MSIFAVETAHALHAFHVDRAVESEAKLVSASIAGGHVGTRAPGQLVAAGKRPHRVRAPIRTGVLVGVSHTGEVRGFDQLRAIGIRIEFQLHGGEPLAVWVQVRDRPGCCS